MNEEKTRLSSTFLICGSICPRCSLIFLFWIALCGGQAASRRFFMSEPRLRPTKRPSKMLEGRPSKILAGGFRAMPRHGLGPQPLHFLIFSGLVRENGESGSLRHSLRDSLRQQGRRSAPSNFRGVETPRFYRARFPQTAKLQPTKKREQQSGVEAPHSKKAKAKTTGCARKLRKEWVLRGDCFSQG